MKALKRTLLSVFLFIPVVLFAQNEKEFLSPVKFEHLRINVADKDATAKWYVHNVRDPNGFTSQLIYRVNQFFPKPVKSTIRFEHFAYNTPDQKIAALWYVEFLELNVPWSKDIDTTKNNYHNYRVPYVGDAGRNMSLELFGKPDVPMTLAQMKHDEVHIAYSTSEPEKLARRMVYGGAKIVTPVRKESNGDMIIDMVDPYNFPIRLIKRAKPILVKKRYDN